MKSKILMLVIFVGLILVLIPSIKTESARSGDVSNHQIEQKMSDIKLQKPTPTPRPIPPPQDRTYTNIMIAVVLVIIIIVLFGLILNRTKILPTGKASDEERQ